MEAEGTRELGPILGPDDDDDDEEWVVGSKGTREKGRWKEQLRDHLPPRLSFSSH